MHAPGQHECEEAIEKLSRLRDTLVQSAREVLTPMQSKFQPHQEVSLEVMVLMHLSSFPQFDSDNKPSKINVCLMKGNLWLNKMAFLS